VPASRRAGGEGCVGNKGSGLNGTSMPLRPSWRAPQAFGTLPVLAGAAAAALVPLTPGLPSLRLPRFGRPSLFRMLPRCRRDKDGLPAFLSLRGPTAHLRPPPPLLCPRRRPRLGQNRTERRAKEEDSRHSSHVR